MTEGSLVKTEAKGRLFRLIEEAGLSEISTT
jgi:hypothetical protein